MNFGRVNKFSLKKDSQFLQTMSSYKERNVQKIDTECREKGEQKLASTNIEEGEQSCILSTETETSSFPFFQSEQLPTTTISTLLTSLYLCILYRYLVCRVLHFDTHNSLYCSIQSCRCGDRYLECLFLLCSIKEL